jgi:hypothetical protein
VTRSRSSPSSRRQDLREGKIFEKASDAPSEKLGSFAERLHLCTKLELGKLKLAVRNPPQPIKMIDPMIPAGL